MLKLEFERRQARLTQAALGRETGIHPTTVSQIESGRIRPSSAELARFAEALAFEGDPQSLVDEVHQS